jgi:hypothetical protein
MSHFQVVTVAVPANPTLVPIPTLEESFRRRCYLRKAGRVFVGCASLRRRSEWCKLVFILAFAARYPTCFAFSPAHVVCFLVEKDR